MGENFKHGLFGEMKDENKLIDVEDLELDDITEYVKQKTKQGTDVFKCVISLNSEDAKNLGYTSKAKWKELVELKINDIVKNAKPPIPVKDLEYIGAFHIKEPNMHCHISFWNKNQEDFTTKPFLPYGEIRKELSKEVFKETLKEVYLKKDEYKKEFREMSKEELTKYKDDFKKLLNINKDQDIKLNFVETKDEENFINKQVDILKQMDKNAKIYIYDKNNPNNFTEISKEYFTKDMKGKNYSIGEEKTIDGKTFLETINFKNHGENEILYKENSLQDTALFMFNLKEIEVVNSKDEFQKILNDFNEKEEFLDTMLAEISPDLMPKNIYSNVYRESSLR